MRYRKNILVFDTETTGHIQSPLIYDIGWAILDENLNVVVKREYLVREIFTNEFLMNSAYYINKKPAYDKRVANKEIQVWSIIYIYQKLMKDIKRYKVSSLAAYNIQFDMRAMYTTLKLTQAQLTPKWYNLTQKKKLICLWGLACDTILLKQEFKNIAQEQEWLTDKGNILTNAEVAYRYITNDLEFEEEHTALKDVEVEIEILKHILINEKGLINYGIRYNPWQKVNKK